MHCDSLWRCVFECVVAVGCIWIALLGIVLNCLFGLLLWMCLLDCGFVVVFVLDFKVGCVLGELFRGLVISVKICVLVL